jgi:hypothetical protein
MFTALFLAGTALITGPATAAPASPSAAVEKMDPERVALVKDLLVTIQAEAMVNQMVQNMIERMDLSGGQRLSTQQEAAVRQLMGSVKRGFARTMPEMFEAMIPVYADVYTEQELRDVIAFFKTPSGQAYVAKSVQASAAAMEAVSSVIPRYVAYTEEDYCSRVECGDAERQMFDRMYEGVQQSLGRSPSRD